MIDIIERRHPTDKPQGTGFAVAHDGDALLLVTCWHVVETIGPERLHIKGQRGALISDPGGQSLDLAILRVPGLPGLQPLSLTPQGVEGLPVQIYGFGPEGRRLNGTLGQRTAWSHAAGEDLAYWDYYLNDQAGAFERIKNGYSGSPIYDPTREQVVAVVTHRVGEDKGFAISVAELPRVYPEAAAWLGAPMPQPDTKPVAQAFKVGAKTAVRKLPETFLVAFSFAGEQRELVRRIAEAVEARLGQGSVFLDAWFEHYLAGADADLKLQAIYGKRSELVVVCVAERYGEKPWTLIEHESIRARLMQARASNDERDRDRILPIRVGDGDVPGIHFNAIVPDVRDRTPDAAADLIVARLELASGEPPSSQEAQSETTRDYISVPRDRTDPAARVETPSTAETASRVNERRRRGLEQQLSLLTAQWQAALEEGALQSGAARVRAEQEAAALEQRIDEIERQLAGEV
ncbi:trypsin-like peptidase domain-containing protein [Rhabdochromatium marinum]|uniref:trypsin-like peptidase domain-containing protein n=1 Tax=Rhabdochromatium marinum TaxID=48729 RepID=UPI0019058526|nr:trypsin-like peptidase domain-containing protein [Rhabdochromatium marinum]MBK1650373.1 hypothetical protein [Rhabdochromatium marinum]